MGFGTKSTWRFENLAGGTDKRATFTLEATNHSAAAVGAGLTFFAIDEMAALILAFCAVRCKEILDARSTAGNRLSQHCLHSVIESDNHRLAQLTCHAVRMESRAKEHFVRVNISDSCDHLLMHQQRLQPSTSGFHQTDKLIARHREGIDPEAASAVAVDACLIE